MTWIGRDSLGRITDFSASEVETDSDTPPNVTVTGSPAVVHYSEEDPGAVGAGHIWIRPEANITGSFALLIRNAGDSAWLTPALIKYDGDTPEKFVHSANTITARNSAGDIHGTVSVGAGVVALTVADEPGGAAVAAIELLAHDGGAESRVTVMFDGLHVGAAADGATNPVVTSGSADPSAGGGVAAPQGSVYMRTNGQLWTKTGATDTGWTQMATVA